VENFCSARSAPQRGQAGGVALLLNTNFSKTWPQLGQTYSKMGMVIY